MVWTFSWPLPQHIAVRRVLIFCTRAGFCSDVSNRQSFLDLQSWLDEVYRYSTNTDAVIMLVANKIDKVSFVYSTTMPSPRREPLGLTVKAKRSMNVYSRG